MQEIGPNVFIETEYAGVTLGVISIENSVIMVDAPFLPEEIRSWRSSVAGLNGKCFEKYHVNLDAHIDRIMGVKAMDAIVVGHEALNEIFQTRPFPYRSQSLMTGADWEAFENVSTFRWALPELTFRNEMTIYCGDIPVVLQECGGVDQAALWVKLPQQRILFVGDVVVLNQPPFFANAQIPLWIETLHCLQNPKYDDYTLIGGRNGRIGQEDICAQIQYLEKVQIALDELNNRRAPESEIVDLIPDLMKGFDCSTGQTELYQRRLLWGLTLYYLKNYFPEKMKETEA